MKTVFIGADQDKAGMAALGIRIRWPEVQSLVAASAQEGLELVGDTSPDVIFLHTSFSDMSLQEAIQGFRRFTQTPLIILGSPEKEVELVMALEVGADDYIRVPFELTVLMARVAALLRRFQGSTQVESDKPIRSGPIFINPATYELFLDGRPVTLTSTEFRVLYTLVKNCGSVVPHDSLERTIWGEEHDSSGLIKKYIQGLRAKLMDPAEDSRFIASIHGVGYRFVGPTPEFISPEELVLVPAS